VVLTQGIYIGAGEDAGERVIQEWDAISERDGEVVPDYGFTQAERELASAETVARAGAVRQ
jgi:hypothetical protein